MQNGSKKLVNWGKEAEFSKRAVETQSQLGSSTAASNTEIDLLFLTEFPGDVATLQKIHAAIVESWKLFGARFREYWSSLSLELRRDFISAFAPNLAKSVNQPPRTLADFLMPDFNLDVLVPEMNFPHLIDHWATQEFLDVLYDDLDHAYDLQHRQPKLLMQDPRFKPTDFTFTSPTDWKTYAVNDMKYFKTTPVFAMMQEGKVQPGNVFWTAAVRFSMNKGVIVSCLYEYITSILKDKWTFGFCQKCAKSGYNLQKCGKCFKAKYCSRECQVSDWTTHKLSCAPK